MNWENLKFLLAFYRAGTLVEAAQRLGVDATTVSRRLAALQDETGVAFLERSSGGALTLTRAGQKAVQHVEMAETALVKLDEDLTGARFAEEGIVRISSVPVVVNSLLIPRASEFASKHPGIELHLASEGRNVSLPKRETDMAIRLGRPGEGGHNVKAKRIAVLNHAIYSPSFNRSMDLPWVQYHEDMSFLPQARWVAENGSSTKGELSNVRPYDLEGVIEAVAAGLGKSALPTLIAEKDERLSRLAKTEPELLREVWLLQHADQASLARMKTVSHWLEEIFSVKPHV
ncbi:LysR family transcriptional regulator [Roseibium porphyridii]|uniref:LysR family transcriptional regulator n=1 Tax=Roseibium porphyridii TaxID=2866279 RepID=A0ABY8F4Q0_9HYPH|nr:LysR family transcriptional regulator [Roseibium sp. KMA01]WFE88830.1 LysR family transcriptional regulator [Roseibium sp. KMA01]